MAGILTGVSQASLVSRPRAHGSLQSYRFPIQRLQFHSPISRGVSIKTAFSAIHATDSKIEDIEILPDSNGGDSSNKGIPGDGGSGGGGGRGDNDGKSGEDGESNDKSQKIAMSMSQKLTLGYAALVGVGGLMGYLKSGSQKSLWAGGISASLLLTVFNLLPTTPAVASAIGLGLSASLLVVMGSRFKNSGKIFPAGVISLVSFIMSGGYVHGILRSLH